MSAYIVIHTTKCEGAKAASKYLCETLNTLYPTRAYLHYNGRVVVVDDRIYIDLRCGTDPDKLAGIRPNYWYSDDYGGVIPDMLEQGACKCNGKRLDNIEQVVQIVIFYMTMFSEIDEYLAGKET